MTLVPESFHDFFIAMAGASGALVGLMFVAISVTRENPLGPEAKAVDRVRATSALIALTSPLLLSLISLLPGDGFGVSSSVVAGLGILYALSALRRLISAPGTRWERVRSISILLTFVVIMGVALIFGIVLLRDPADPAPVNSISAALVASVALGISRAWELVGGQATTALGSLSDLLHSDAGPVRAAATGAASEGAAASAVAASASVPEGQREEQDPE